MKQLRMHSRAKGQRGLSLVMVLGILAMLALAGWLVSANSSSGNASSTANAASNAAATAVIEQSNALVAGYQMAALNGVAPEDVTLDAAATTGLYHPSVGSASQPLPLLKASTSATPAWQIDATADFGLGTASNDVALLLPDVKEAVCLSIERTFRGQAATIGTAPVAGSSQGCYLDGTSHTAYVVVGAR